ncbi:hypothetical protein KI387_011694, partial [Taxus chinensis]
VPQLDASLLNLTDVNEWRASIAGGRGELKSNGGEMSQCFLSKEETIEIPFLWALYFFVGTLMADALPQGFKERVQRRGIVVGDWAPQREIL